MLPRRTLWWTLRRRSGRLRRKPGAPSTPASGQLATMFRDEAEVTECDDSMNFCAVPKILRESGLTLFQRGCYSQGVPIGRGFEPAGIVLGSSARSASTQTEDHASSPLCHVPQELRMNTRDNEGYEFV